MNRHYQLQWMVLLALAVILPTVSLLWFMSRAVTNERLVIQQKLGEVYEQKLKDLNEKARQQAKARLDALGRRRWALNPYGLLSRLVFEEDFQGCVLWSPSGELIYPSRGEPAGSNNRMNDSDSAAVWQLEFVDKDYAAAAEKYEQRAALNDAQAQAGLVRCRVHLRQWDAALEAALNSSTASVRLLLLSLLQKDASVPDRQIVMEHLIQALDRDLFKGGAAGGKEVESASGYLSAGQNLFLARSLLDALEQLEYADVALVERLSALAHAEAQSIALREKYPLPEGAIDVFVPAVLDGQRVYTVRHPTPFGELMMVMDDDGLASALVDGYQSELADADVQYRIFDAKDRLLAGTEGKNRKAIAEAPLPEGFPEGRIELFFADGNAFNRAANREVAVYIWTGALVIVLMLLVGIFAIQAVGRQIRLNKMKNNFIATVSHELKTPLASMRLLVDTLLEKRVRDEAHAEQYLRMIARENERLTRMIENFLSFSRMERNKNAFTFSPVSPAAVVEDAIDSVCTKFRANHCMLETSIAENLPECMADHDAIVTVLINLLDNACKYTTENKQIELSVFEEAGEIGFAVSDNGIGLSRRQIRRIFDSFYQADDTLTRSTEGCGLGLSIVQFIVNAHKGRITVESQPEQGSTFTVRLPISA